MTVIPSEARNLVMGADEILRHPLFAGFLRMTRQRIAQLRLEALKTAAGDFISVSSASTAFFEQR